MKCSELIWALSLKTAIAMLLVVKLLKSFTLSFQIGITFKPLPTKELSVVGVVEVLDNTVAPRL